MNRILIGTILGALLIQSLSGCTQVRGKAGGTEFAYDQDEKLRLKTSYDDLIIYLSANGWQQIEEDVDEQEQYVRFAGAFGSLSNLSVYVTYLHPADEAHRLRFRVEADRTIRDAAGVSDWDILLHTLGTLRNIEDSYHAFEATG